MSHGRPAQEYVFRSVGPEERRDRFVRSVSFEVMYKKGMALVEETAAYLDGPGRNESAALDRHAKLVYATESMRLTTRLMTVASWLLLVNSVKDGQMHVDHMFREKSRIKTDSLDTQGAPESSLCLLPQAIQDLVARSLVIAGEVRRMDTAHFPRKTT